MRERDVTHGRCFSARCRGGRRLAFLASCLSFVVLAVGASELAGASASSMPAPSEGADVRVNTPGDADEQGPTCNIQNEVSLASWGNNVVAGWNDSSQCRRLFLRRVSQDDGVGLSLSGFGYSVDGGTTWTDGGLLPPPPGGRIFGDPVLTAGPGGVFYYATLFACITAACPGPTDTLQIGVATSVDGGRTWSTLADVSREKTSGLLHDKPWIAVDTTGSPEEQGDVYVAWTKFDPTGAEGENCRGLPGWSCSVLFSRSTDEGQTWSPPRKLSVRVKHPARKPAEGEFPGIGAQVAAGPDGEVYVSWIENVSNLTRHIWVARSLDGGESFDPPTYVATPGMVGHDPHPCAPARRLDPQGILEDAPGWIDPDEPGKAFGALEILPLTSRMVINGDIRIANWLSMAVDASGSSDAASPDYNPHRGTLYLAVPHDPDRLDPGVEFLTNAPAPYGDESDIAFMFSEDRGATWSNISLNQFDASVPNFIVNDDFIGNGERTRTDQFHPQVAVDSRGRVALSWYDRRSDPWNLDMEMYAAVSTDGGRTFSDNFPVSDRAFPPARTNPNTGGLDGCYMGEYNGMVGADGEFLLAWGDNRDGSEAHPDPNVYFDRISFGTGEGTGGESGGADGEDTGSGGEAGTGSGGPGDSTGTGGGEGGAPATGGQDTSLPLPACNDLPGNHVVGTPGKDVIRGTDGPDVLCGLGGRDRLIGLGHDDVLLGGAGRDLLVGGPGVDACLGGAARDDLRACERRRLLLGAAAP